MLQGVISHLLSPLVPKLLVPLGRCSSWGFVLMSVELEARVALLYIITPVTLAIKLAVMITPWELRKKFRFIMAVPIIGCNGIL